MVASILANEVIRVPISSFRLRLAGMSEALLAVASWAAREMAEATSHPTKPPPAIRRPVKARSAGIGKASADRQAGARRQGGGPSPRRDAPPRHREAGEGQERRHREGLGVLPDGP